jgi:peptide/nickel transport system substrate-binding protein
MLPALLAAAILGTLSSAACTRVETGSRAAGGERSASDVQTLRVAFVATPNTLNPILSTQQFETQAETFAFDPLIATDPDGNDVPMLAAIVPTLANGGISADGLHITYHLRHGVVWQDGAPFTSADVKFTFGAIMNPDTVVSTRHGYDQVARVETPDPYTAVFVLKRRFAPAVHTFFAHSDAPFMILPAHLLTRYHDLNRIPYNSLPIGTGPFRIVKWARGDRIEYVANDRYFMGKPKLRKIVIHLVPDENTVVNQMRTHDIDWFALATPRAYLQLRSLPGIVNHLVPFNGADSIMFNVTKPPFDDARVRRAVGLALDKERIVDDVTFGTTIPATEDIPSFMWAFNPTAGTRARNLPQARALLTAAGWRPGPDGIRVRNGQRLNPTIAFRTESATDRERSVLIVAMLREAGFDAQLKGYTTGLLYGPVGSGIEADGKYQAALNTWYAGIDPDDSTQLLCKERPPHGYDWSRYCNAELDAAEGIALSHYDLPTRKRAYARIQEILARDAPFVYLWWPRQIEPVSAKLRGFRPNGIIENWNSWEWSL